MQADKCVVKAAVFCMLMFLLLNDVGSFAYSVQPMTLKDAISEPVYRLFQWPQAEILNGPGRLDPNDEDVLAAKRQCQEWADRVLAPAWNAPDGTEKVFLRDEFDGRDVVRSVWERNGYRVSVSQTATYFTLMLSPLDDSGTGTTQAEKVEKARQLCLEVFASSGKRRGAHETGLPRQIPIDDLATRIATWSFEAGNIEYLDNSDAVYGRPSPAPDSVLTTERSDEERRRDIMLPNAEWYNTAYAYAYWFRQVYWWNDGSAVRFFFLKVEAGPWQPCYDSSLRMDREFFRYLPPHHIE